jgi:hypothetical protein
LFLNEKFSDLTFNFDDGTVLNGHKIVLAMQVYTMKNIWSYRLITLFKSDPFYAMFTNNMMRESSQVYTSICTYYHIRLILLFSATLRCTTPILKPSN